MNQNATPTELTVIIPAKNEAEAIGDVVTTARSVFPAAEILVVDDGSKDGTGEIASRAGARVIRHPDSLGNGAAVKTGARAATGEFLALMDGDGQHDARDFLPMLTKLATGYEMVIGARSSGSHASLGRLFANATYNGFASLLSGRRILDLTSGFRVVRASLFKQFLYLLPNGFSYPTTITMAFLRSGYPVSFEPIEIAGRAGISHIRPVRDGIRFLVIIFKVAMLYSPLKIFLPTSAVLLSIGIGLHAYTHVTDGRLTNTSLLLLSAAVLIFLVGLISEQVAALTYSKS